MTNPQDRDIDRDDRPPQWAEDTLYLVLRHDRRECVSGDLLEEYRADILPLRGPKRADVWYVRQVLGYVGRSIWGWAALFCGAVLVRAATDWLVPVTDFHARSRVTSAFAMGVLVSAGLWAGWRSKSGAAGGVVAAMTTLASALASTVGLTIMLTLWHDPATLSAIENSGGLAEAYALPYFTVFPAIVIGAVGGVAGKGLRMLLS
jgi:hypothetical protein